MSVKVMTLVFEYEGLKSTEKLILLAYADHADDSGANVYPSVETVARKTNLNKRTVQRKTKELEEDGFLFSQGWAHCRTKKWRINVNKLRGAAESHPGRESHEGAAENPTEGGSVPPESSINHQDNTSLCEGKHSTIEYFLDCFGAKRFKTKIQGETLLQLEEKFGTETLLEATDWAAKQGMNMGRAILSLETALPKWNKRKIQPPQGSESLPGYSVEELRKIRRTNEH